MFKKDAKVVILFVSDAKKQEKKVQLFIISNKQKILYVFLLQKKSQPEQITFWLGKYDRITVSCNYFCSWNRTGTEYCTLTALPP